ncbi:ComF family protein [Frondihabitans cladoniiphilus]|uniref:ComF family protein n=1 Tax=Frondihabitans cladoniiphilus TaxID=715785 RepID=A0ABP8WEK1_9MICO
MTSLAPPSIVQALLSALALVSPVDCAGCGRADVELCPACRTRLRPALRRAALPDGTPLVSGLEYSGAVRDVVLAFKQQGRWRLGRPLAPAVQAALLAAAGAGSPGAGAGPPEVGAVLPDVGASSEAGAPPGVVVVAVPSSAAGLRRRGYDPVRVLLRAARVRPAPRGLRVSRASGVQKGRSRAERQAARVGTLAASRRLTGHRVVVVDDVVTTGSSLVEAVRACSAVGADVVGAACLADTPLVSESAA